MEIVFSLFNWINWFPLGPQWKFLGVRPQLGVSGSLCMRSREEFTTSPKKLSRSAFAKAICEGCLHADRQTATISACFLQIGHKFHLILVHGAQSMVVLNVKVSKSVRMSRRKFSQMAPCFFFFFFLTDCTVRVFQRLRPAAINKTLSSPVASIFSYRALCLELSASFNPLLSAKADKVACCVLLLSSVNGFLGVLEFKNLLKLVCQRNNGLKKVLVF